jgi:hypothetical protein
MIVEKLVPRLTAGAVTIEPARVGIGTSGALALTLAAPTAGIDDGIVMTFFLLTAQAHTVDIAGGLAGAGSSANLVTFTAALNGNFQVTAYNGAWYLTSALTGCSVG